MNLKECFLRFVRSEEDSARLYQSISEVCSEKLKSIVISFSIEEEKHKQIMLELSNNEALKEKHLGEDVEVIFQNQADGISYNDKKSEITSEKELFVLALQLEKDSVEIYTKLLCIFEPNSYEYKRFESLIKEERKHMIYILNKLYEMK